MTDSHGIEHGGDGPDGTSEELVRFVVDAESVGQRLDAFLTKSLQNVSRARIQKAIAAGAAIVDGIASKASLRLEADQVVDFTLPPAAASGPAPEPLPLDILYEDADLAVINKPPNMVVHPAKGHWAGTLASGLMYHFAQLSQFGGATRPGIVHRLDRDTSGVIVVAKNDRAHELLAQQFQNRTVEKEYLAIVAGVPTRDRDWIDQAIAPHPSQREKMILRADRPESRAAQTFYQIEERFRGFALVRAMPKTGRTHQIRLHLAHIRCPVLCDKLYGGRAKLQLAELRTITRTHQLAAELPGDFVVLNRQALHAHVLRFRHPITGEPMDHRAELPADMQKLLLLLKQTSQTS